MDDVRILAVHEALERLGSDDLMKVKIINLKFFVGLGNSEIAASPSPWALVLTPHWMVDNNRLHM